MFSPTRLELDIEEINKVDGNSPNQQPNSGATPSALLSEGNQQQQQPAGSSQASD